MGKDFGSILIKIAGSELAAAWKGTRLDKVEVYADQKIWKLHVSVEDPFIIVETLRVTTERLRSFFPFLDDLEIIPNVKNSRENIDKILKLHQDDLFSSLLNCSDIGSSVRLQVEEGRVDLLSEDYTSYEYIIANGICTKLSDWFWQKFSLRVLVRALCEKSASVEVMDHAFVVRSKIGVLEGGNSDEKRSARLFKRKGRTSDNRRLKNAEPMKIAQLEEGLKAAVTEGEIWNKEISALKDGRFVVTYFMTDYNDTVIIKSFLDRIEEDTIKIGDWVRVSGKVRYDSFVKEIILLMESCIHLKKPTREDICDDKRIELHAHTKMSAMDGLTEVEDLVERAAKWKHPAIAITDHGCVQAFPDAYRAAQKHKIKVIYGVEAYLVEEEKKDRPYHVILLAYNQTGLKNLYRLVTVSYIDYFYRQPKIPRKVLQKYREGLLVGSACEAGELYSAYLQGRDEKKIEEIASFYDYLEIQPLDNNKFLIRDGRVESEDALKRINKSIVGIGKKLNKPVVATGDVHFLEPHHEIFRRIIQAGQGYEDAESQAPLYFRTTDEMLQDFAYLGEKDARAVVIDNPALINGMIEDLKPVPEGFYPPEIEGADEEVINLAWEKAHSLYGEDLPMIVEERIKRELDSITKHGFSVLYLIAHRLVRRSNEDGYLVGSRGSVGSSLVAYLIGITEVNPLQPHYLCPRCSYSKFIADGSAACGVDLEDEVCPVCGHIMRKDGFDIPFETFLGFEGDKVPDIDLNFSGVYQSCAHQYVEKLFGSENVFRAGTISTIAEKTAYGFVKNYMESMQIDIKNSEINRLVKGITGVRRTTGQHPGGLIVVPRDRDILEFTPLQYPADNKEAGVITTHFDYHAVGDQLIKLDILGHDDPTVIKELEDLTGVKASSINLSDKEVMKIFSSVEPLGVTPEEIGSSIGTYGIPEFGTRFVRRMLEVTKPTTFSELVKISGLSHGTDVWLNNAQTLIENNVAKLNEVICTRDDIMTYLIQQGVNKKKAFKIMENVRRGRGLNKEEVSLLQESGVPSWYIESCQKIKYMFPKAHAVAYVTMAFRIAYFKVHYPLQFYASFFSIRAEDFDAGTILAGSDSIREMIREIEKMGAGAPQKKRKLLPILEVALEAYARGVKFFPVDIYRSDAEKFLVLEDGLLLPFSALPNVGITAAREIVAARAEGDFVSVEDFQFRARVNKAAVDVLRENNCFRGLPEANQISLFGL